MKTLKEKRPDISIELVQQYIPHLSMKKILKNHLNFP